MQGEADAVHGVLKRVKAQEFSFSGVQAAYLVQELGRQPPSTLHLDCVELLLESSLEDPESARQVGVPASRLLRILLEKSIACGEPVSRLTQYLSKAASTAGLPEADIGWFAEFAWSQSGKLAEQGQWGGCAALQECAHALLGRSGGGKAAAKAHCAAAIARSLLKQAKCEEGEKDVRDLRQRAAAWAEKGRAVLLSKEEVALGDQERAAADQAALAGLQFQALCLLRSPLLQGQTGDALLVAAAGEGQARGRAVARLARVAVEAGDAAQAARCLRAYLRLASAAPAAAGPAAAAARRELAGLRLGAQGAGAESEEAAKACEEAVGLLRLRAGGGAASNGFPPQLPEKEALWLAAVVWNCGSELLATPGSQQELAVQRMRLGLDLFKLVGDLSPSGGDITGLHARLEESLAACEVAH